MKYSHKISHTKIILFIFCLCVTSCSAERASNTPIHEPTAGIQEGGTITKTPEADVEPLSTSSIVVDDTLPDSTPIPTTAAIVPLEDTPLVFMNNEGRYIRSSFDDINQKSVFDFPRISKNLLEDISSYRLRAYFDISPNNRFYAAHQPDGLRLQIYSLKNQDILHAIDDYDRFFGWSHNSELFVFRRKSNTKQICIGHVAKSEVNCLNPFEGDVFAASFSPINHDQLAVSVSANQASEVGQPLGFIYHVDNDVQTKIGLQLVPFEIVSPADLIEWTSEGIIIHGNEEAFNVDTYYKIKEQTTDILTPLVTGVNTAGTYWIDNNHMLYATNGTLVGELESCASNNGRETIAWSENFLAQYIQCDGEETGVLSVTNLLNGQTVMYPHILSGVEYLEWYRAKLIISVVDDSFFSSYYLSEHGELKPIANDLLFVGTLGAD